MEKESRTQKVLYNSFITLACQVVSIVVSFACRTFFSVLLGQEYLGINGLFANILTILSFADLGLGRALVYRMYAPTATGDHNKLRLMLNLYRKIYMVIMLVVSACGLLIMPFLEYLIDAPHIAEDIRLIYLLYLADTVITYAYSYKKSVLIADQKNYVVSLYEQLFNIIMNVVQILVLLLTHNFILYCLVKTACNIGNNLACAAYVDRKYPHLKEPTTDKLDRSEVEGLKRDTFGLLLNKITRTIFIGTDNLFVSAFIGIQYVGILDNHVLILTVTNGIMNRVFGSATASIGNLAATDDPTKTKSVLKKMFFANSAMYVYMCTGLILLLGQFISEIWLNETYLLPAVTVFTVVFELFLRGIHYPLQTTQTALGLFSQKKVFYVMAALLNILLNFVLVKPLGITGLYIATILTRGITYVLDICIVYKHGFGEKPWSYFRMLAGWLIFFGGCLGLMSLIIGQLAWPGIFGFIGKILIITAVYAILFFLVFSRTEEFRYFMDLMKSIGGKLKSKLHK